MPSNKKPRKSHRPKTKVCGLGYVLAGLRRMEGERLVDLQSRNHAAMFKMAQGYGDRETWDMLVGAINMAIVMQELGTGSEYRETLLGAQTALLHCGRRALNNGHRFVFTGDELRAMNDAMEVHDAQIEASRQIDLERAFDEVMRRVRTNENVRKVTEAA